MATDPKEQFIVDLYPAALKVSQETGMSWETILAQAAQETGWGQHQLPGTHNIFNIKADSGWHGPSATFNVPEIENGKKVWLDQPFRVYGSNEEALLDRVAFLQDNPRYAKAGLLDEGTRGDLYKEAQALQKAGYATDSNYADGLVRVFNSPIMQKAIKHAQALDHSGVAHDVSATPVAYVGAKSEVLLEQGARGEAVHLLQKDLAKFGYTGAEGYAIKADGDFGLNTKHALETFQRDHHLTVDGKAGPRTLAALHQQGQTHVVTAPLSLNDQHHPDHAMYEQALDGVHKLDASMGRTPDQQSANLAASLVVASRKEGLKSIDSVVLSEDGSRAFAVQGDIRSPTKEYASVSTAQAVNTPVAQSSAAALAVQAVQPAAVVSPAPTVRPTPQAPSL